MTIGELIERLGGKLAQGRPETEITGVNGCERVTPTELVFAEDAASAAAALKSPAAAVVLKAGLAATYASNPSIAVVEAISRGSGLRGRRRCWQSRCRSAEFIQVRSLAPGSSSART